MTEVVKRTPWDHGQSRHDRGYGYTWELQRKRILKRDRYLCVPCYERGIPMPATSVDHIVAKAKGGTDEATNLRSLCSECRAKKDAADRGQTYRPKVRIGLDGWPE